MSDSRSRIVEASCARAVADLAEGLILASVEVTATPERVFRALASPEIIAWWIRPGVFNTTEWSGEPRVGAKWQAGGVGGGKPYGLEGEFLEVESPRRLVHTWRAVGAPGAPSTVAYRLEPTGTGTRITLRHSGIGSPQVCLNTCIGWETSFEQLALFLSVERPA